MRWLNPWTAVNFFDDQTLSKFTNSGKKGIRALSLNQSFQIFTFYMSINCIDCWCSFPGVWLNSDDPPHLRLIVASRVQTCPWWFWPRHTSRTWNVWSLICNTDYSWKKSDSDAHRCLYKELLSIHERDPHYDPYLNSQVTIVCLYITPCEEVFSWKYETSNTRGFESWL